MKYLHLLLATLIIAATGCGNYLWNEPAATPATTVPATAGYFHFSYDFVNAPFVTIQRTDKPEKKYTRPLYQFSENTFVSMFFLEGLPVDAIAVCADTVINPEHKDSKFIFKIEIEYANGNATYIIEPEEVIKSKGVQILRCGNALIPVGSMQIVDIQLLPLY